MLLFLYITIEKLDQFGSKYLKKIVKKFILLDENRNESEMGFSMTWIISSNKFEDDEKRKEK